MKRKQLHRHTLSQQIIKNITVKDWNNLSLQDIAHDHEVSLVDLHTVFQDKTDILIAFGQSIDHTILENIASPDFNESPREALFDILMDRFETLNEYRSGVVSVLHAFGYDPKQAIISLPHLCRSMTWMLEASGIETTGIRGAVKVTGLTGLYLKVLNTWKSDESPDLSKTMATLDKGLKRAEDWANMFGL